MFDFIDDIIGGVSDVFDWFSGDGIGGFLGDIIGDVGGKAIDSMFQSPTGSQSSQQRIANPYAPNELGTRSMSSAGEVKFDAAADIKTIQEEWMYRMGRFATLNRIVK